MFDTKFSSVYRGFDSEAIPVNRKNYIKKIQVSCIFQMCKKGKHVTLKYTIYNVRYIRKEIRH